jgi:osmotically-inducible protein OsmY
MNRSRLFVSLRWTTLIAACLIANTGCVLAVGGAAVGSALVATDRRSSGVQLEDAEIEHRVSKAMDTLFARRSVQIDVTSYSGKVLLAGTVPTEKDRQDAEVQAAYQQNVKHVINELTIGSLTGFNSSADDVILAAKVRASLLDVKGLPPGVVKVSVTLGHVYLFGKVSQQESTLAKDQASRISGVKRVVVLFDVLTPEEFSRLNPAK